jgi:hypothetical protein
MDQTVQRSIESQLEKLKSGSPEIQLIKPCLLNKGIIQLNKIENLEFKDVSISWFIPASGSGSRMFQFLFDYLNDGDFSKKEIQLFHKSFYQFAFHQKIGNQIKKGFEENNLSLRDLIEFILSDKGLNFSKLPKGLVPFHQGSWGLSNPFQDSIIQGMKLSCEKINFHFTIQKEFEKEIKQSISEILINETLKIEFSEQSKDTDSIAFNNELIPISISENDYLKRPSGHGALLSNLNRVESDYILIRNIDNIQHSSKSKRSFEVWTNLLNLTIQIKKELAEVYRNPTKEIMSIINRKYALFDSKHIDSLKNSDEILALINRPLRICGMVKNSGQPGGGPFWVKAKNGFLTKQIIEKAQISNNINQQTVLENSTHFNPVMIVAAVKDFNGKKYDLKEFVDEQSYFIVAKNHEGKAIQYIENPGLWNGSMANWTSVFVEIPSEVFSPVKTILDLLDDRHLE